MCPRRTVELHVTLETATKISDADWTFSLARDGVVVGWDGLVGQDYSGELSPALWLLKEYLASFLGSVLTHGQQMSFEDLLEAGIPVSDFFIPLD